jgi:hypothetical protein
MISFETLNDDLKEILIKEGISENDLYSHYSDLYVGCKDFSQARRILTGGVWKGLSSTFVPQKGSDMDKYPCAVDIALGAMVHDFNSRKIIH